MGIIICCVVENIWFIVSNVKKNCVGLEFKVMVKVFEGYSFVGVDVDFEEFWIVSLIGDVIFKFYGGNVVGFMILEGIKVVGIDLYF